jgi:hypothetical protein
MIARSCLWKISEFWAGALTAFARCVEIGDGVLQPKPRIGTKSTSDGLFLSKI